MEGLLKSGELLVQSTRAAVQRSRESLLATQATLQASRLNIRRSQDLLASQSSAQGSFEDGNIQNSP